jgi:hypothetical protein
VNTEAILFLLRLISGLLLMSFLVALFVIIWRDYRSTIQQMSAIRRTYGKLVEMCEIDGTRAVTGETYPLLPLTSLGRAPTNAIVIHDTFASSEHASVFMRDGQWWLEDRQSRNGTRLNNVSITEPIVITDGDIIGIGTLYFRLVLE